MVARRLFRKRYAAPGSPPGTMVIPKSAAPPRIHTIRYDAETVLEEDIEDLSRLDALRQEGRVLWVDVQGLGDERIIRDLGERFGLHHLAQSDITNIGQRVKAEDYDETLFVITLMVRPDPEEGLVWEQVSAVIGPGWVLTFQERYGDCLDALRGRIRRKAGPVRCSGSDYLGCMVIDAIIDGYFPVLESLGDRLEDLETRVIERPGPETLADIFAVKRDLMTLRRAIWPQREFLARLTRDGHALLTETTMPYLRDAYDHAVHIVDVTETYRELAQSFVDVYLSSMANRTNETMRVLTVFATIFIPLTFLAGVYGMNFDPDASPLNMPELNWRYGYVAFWIVAVMVAAAMLWMARRKGWLGGSENGRGGSA